MHFRVASSGIPVTWPCQAAPAPITTTPTLPSRSRTQPSSSGTSAENRASSNLPRSTAMITFASPS